MKKSAIFYIILAFFSSAAMAAEQCKILSDAEYTKMFTNHTTSVLFNVQTENQLETSQWDMFYNKNGIFSSTWHLFLDHTETMRLELKGQWAIHNTTLSTKISECHHTTSQDPSENEFGDEFCKNIINAGFDPIKIDPCNPFSMDTSADRSLNNQIRHSK